MNKIIFCVLVLCFATNIFGLDESNQQEQIYEWDDPRINILGSGWNILTNEPAEAVFVLNSTTRSDPFQQILSRTLPKGVVMINSPKATFHIYADVIDQNVNIEDSRDIKVDGGSSFWIIKGSFGVESKIVKKFISKLNTKTTRTYSSVVLAEFQLQSWHLDLAPGIKDRLIKIGILLEKNTPISIANAIYLIDEILNIFGTHIVIYEKIGGILEKIDSIDISGFDNNVAQTLSAGASASFGSYFNIGGKYGTQHSQSEAYNRATRDFDTSILGGDPWKVSDNYTYDDWVDTLKTNPATIGVKLIYILDIIREQYLPDFTFQQLVDIRKMFEYRLDVYLRNNYYKGCADPTASNYVSYANVFDSSLCNHQHTFYFGGLYTVSNSANYQVNNLITQALSCPTNFIAHQLLHLQYQGATHSNDVCIKHKHHKHCHTEYWYEQITTDTFVCLSHQNESTSAGMYFGGVYTSTIINDITQSKSCPQKYVAFPIFHNYEKTDITYVCQAPYDSGNIISLPFGGIFSSQNPNFLVGDKPVCGDGFQRHSVGPRPIAELTYCLEIGSLDNQQRDIIPPGYGNTLNSMLELYSVHEFENGTSVGIMVDPIDERSYFTQVSKIAVDVLLLDSVGENKVIGVKKNHVTHDTCYIRKWAATYDIDANIDDQTDDDLADLIHIINITEHVEPIRIDQDEISNYRPNINFTTNSNDNSHTMIYVIISTSIGSILLTIIIIGLIIRHKLGKQKGYGLIVKT